MNRWNRILALGLSMILALCGAAPASGASSALQEPEIADEPVMADEENLDYILGRPMTEEEILEQKACEPETLTEIPELEPMDDGVIDASENLLDSCWGTFSVLPEKYDSRIYQLQTAVKDQNPWGSCWSFSAIAAAETSVLNKGITIDGQAQTSELLDLSELQLLYFFYHTQPDELGNTRGDQTLTIPRTANYLDVGGHGIFTTFALASWTGLVPESLASYEQASQELSLPSQMASSQDVVHMQNAYWIPMTNVNGIKEMVQQYGSVSCSYNHQETYYNYDTAAYHNPYSSNVNHAVNIVGWDDNYSKENFVNPPETDGAWLVKNNWSEEWGEAGYFWLSYEEACFNSSNAFGYVYDFESAENYQHIYQYDGSSSYSRSSLVSGSSIANVFTAAGSDYEQLQAVSIALYSTYVDYSIQIYRNPTGDPTSGEAMLKYPQTGSTSYAGYYTIPLEQSDVFLKKGDRYAVVFTLSRADGEKVVYLSDSSGTNGGWIEFVNETEPGQSYYKIGDNWEDLGAEEDDGLALGTLGRTARIKAFTSDRTKEEVPLLTGVSMRSSAKLKVGTSRQLKASPVPANALDASTAVWKTSDASVATVTNGKVTGVGVGTAVITCKIGSKKAVCTVKVGLSTPVLKSIQAVGYRKIKVRWSKIAGATQYRVYRRTKTTEWVRVADIMSGSTLSYTDQVPSGTKNYIYTVRARAIGSSGAVLSGYDSTGLKCKAVPAAPVLRSLISDVSYVKVRWYAVKADGYRVYRRTDGGPWIRLTQIPDGAAASFKDKTIKNDHKYTYTVRAFYTNGKQYSLSGYDAAGKTVRR